MAGSVRTTRPRVVRVFLTFASLVSLAAHLGAQSPQPRSAPNLPKDARRALDKAVPKWTFLDAGSVPIASCARAATPPESPAWIAADFDGDLRQDLAFYVDAAGTSKLVVMLDRAPDYVTFTLDLPASGLVPLGLAKRGQRFDVPVSGADDFLSADTLALDRCEAGTSLFVWRGQSFERLDLPPPPAASAASVAATP